MKVAIVYNISEADIESISRPAVPSEISFEPYYDIEYNSSSPLESYGDMARALSKCGYEAYTLNIFDDFNRFLSDYDENRPDVIFNLVEMYNGAPSLEMSFACFLELLRIPYTGAPPLALGTCQRKILTKRILTALGIGTPAFFIVNEPGDLKNIRLRYPMIVKPSQEDASIGIENSSVVYDYDQLRSRTEYMLENFRQQILIEEFIDGREFNISVIGGRRPRALPISEVDFSRMPQNLHKIVSYQAKWDPYDPAYHSTVPVCPAQLDTEVEIMAKQTAVRAFTELGCRDYARVDMRLGKDNKLYILEVNPNPDLTEGAGFMRSSRTAGYSFRRTLKKIVDMAYARGQKLLLQQ